MSKRTIITVLSAEDVAAILAHHVIQSKQIELNPDSKVEAEMLACFEKDAAGGTVGITQYRIEVKVDEVKESWRG